MKQLIAQVMREEQVAEADWKAMASGAMIAASLLTGATNVDAKQPQTITQAGSHFSQSEFKCKHCGQVKCDKELLAKMELLRTKLGNKPIVVTSGYRCPQHNKAVGGVKNSQHVEGKAADIKVRGKSPDEVARAAKAVGFTFTKIYPTWTHVDIR